MDDGEVSVRELRQNLSVCLRRVREGESLAVTSRGERVAVLGPVDGGSLLDRLTAEGRISLPREPWADGPDLGPIDETRPSLTDMLLQMRDEQDRSSPWTPRP